MIEEDQTSFSRAIQNRVKNVMNSVKDVYPAIMGPAPPHIREVSVSHVTQTTSVREGFSIGVMSAPDKMDDFL